MACRFPHDPKLKGLAAVTCRSDIPSHEFDIRAVPEDVEIAEVSDWHRRKGRSPAGREYLRQAAREAKIPRPPYERVESPMFDPPHPGRLVRSCIEESNWTVAGAAERLGVGRTSLSRLLHGKHRISATLALALEDVGWSTAEHWLRVQAIYDLAQARTASGTT